MEVCNKARGLRRLNVPAEKRGDNFGVLEIHRQQTPCDLYVRGQDFGCHMIHRSQQVPC
jgi:hypothetical protein